MTPEEIEYGEIQSELERDLIQSFLLLVFLLIFLHASCLLYDTFFSADRIFAGIEENDSNFYYVKWQNLPYSESTWEPEHLVMDRFPDQVCFLNLLQLKFCTDLKFIIF